jgi:glycerate dehydrogenase
MNIVILDGYTENPGDLSWEGFEKLGELTVYDRSSLTDPQEAIRRINGAEAVIVNKTPITAEVIDACPSIRYIGVLATGYNVVDIHAAREKGIVVTNIPSYGTAAVGQFAIALLLEICHHIGHHDRTVHEGRWENSPDWCYWDYPLIELAGKTMGIIGFGRIGQITGSIARVLGMKVIAHDNNPNETGREIADYVSLDDLFTRSDVICLHCPLFPETTGIINKTAIAKMKDGVILINNSRGPLVVEADLARALNEGKVYAAGTDVVSTEPIRGDNPLLKAKNCIITPHISWASQESRRRLMDIASDNLAAFINGRAVNVVNAPPSGASADGPRIYPVAVPVIKP